MLNNTLTPNDLAAGTTPAAEAPSGPDAVVAQLRAIRPMIPEYVQLPATDRKAFNRVANVDPVFVQASISGTGASPALQNVLGRSPDELRRDTEDAAHWLVVEDELRAMLRGVVAANLLRRHRIGNAALQAYAIGKRLVRDPEHADLLPHVESMTRMQKFGGRKRAKTPPVDPAPAPQS